MATSRGTRSNKLDRVMDMIHGDVESTRRYYTQVRDNILAKREGGWLSTGWKLAREERELAEAHACLEALPPAAV